ncbi:uncharacterized protein LOC114287600 isoform X3 [Camellia sinensis]|uniref:uncharacterized protein LOC114287600 isoform X3 n=1 Tax=Camellia sinensis TaxID=4442 RepID=UPI001036395C|nr:uncharacterized protein LOC114287600 isoform X3 [Camellia sinensis]
MGRDNKSKRRRTVNLKLKDKMQANDAEINKIRAKKLNNHDPSKLVAETPCELLRYLIFLSYICVPFLKHVFLSFFFVFSSLVFPFLLQ